MPDSDGSNDIYIYLHTYTTTQTHSVCETCSLNETVISRHDTQRIWSTIFARIIFGVVTSMYKKKEKKKEEKKQIFSDVGARIVKILIVRNLILSCKTFFERRDREIEFGRAVIIKEVL